MFFMASAVKSLFVCVILAVVALFALAGVLYLTEQVIDNVLILSAEERLQFEAKKPLKTLAEVEGVVNHPMDGGDTRLSVEGKKGTRQ